MMARSRDDPAGVVGEHHRRDRALANRFPVYLEVLAHGHDYLQAVLAHPTRIGGLCHRKHRFSVQTVILMVRRPLLDRAGMARARACRRG
jgi:hypothetical protein